MPRKLAPLVALLVTVPLGFAATPAQAHHVVPRLPLGPAGLAETRTSQQLAPGVSLTTITRGHSDATKNYWTIALNIPVGAVGNDPDPDADKGSLSSLHNVQAVAAQILRVPAITEQLDARGWQPRVEPVDWVPGSPGYAGGLIGYTLRIGRYPSAPTKADPVMAALIAARFSPFAIFTAQDGRPEDTGPWVVRALTVDPRVFHGKVTSTLGTASSGQEATSTMARESGALYAVNGGFFVISPADGTPGVPAGLSVVDGSVQTAATNGRAELVLGDGGRHARIAYLASRYTVSVGRATHQVDGINRPPGVIRDCGGVGGDTPTVRPVQDFTCTDTSELVGFTAQYGAALPAGAGVEALVDPTGVVTAVRPRAGGTAPAGDTVLQAIGDDAPWLTAHAVVGAHVRLDTDLVDQHGRPARLGPDDSVVNGGPVLVHNGRVAVDLDLEGMIHEDARLNLPPSGLGAAFAYNWAVRDNPRTAVGVDDRGRLVIVEVDGRQDKISQGLSIDALAQVMRSLGCVEAINLDGGGSSVAVVNGTLVSSPSDVAAGAQVERKVAEAIVVVPGRSRR